MRVNNLLTEESFAYTEAKENMGMRSDEIGELMKIVAYCRNDLVREPLISQEALWETWVQEGVTFADWLYCGEGVGNDDDRRRLMEALGKKEIILQDAGVYADEAENTGQIRIALGAFGSCIFNVQDYIQKRREILASIREVREYEAFMQSCFVNSCFADGMLSEMKHIHNFQEQTKEITNALGVLNDNAVELYQQYHDHLEEAMNILASLLRRECAPDPAHRNDVVFTFTYSEQLEGKTVARTKEVECSPHLKLIHPGSNLRIYFYWCNDSIGAGEKVLVGRIGRHPY